MNDDPAAARLDRWKLSVLDLSRRDRLIDARLGASAIALPGVHPAWLAAALSAGGRLVLEARGPHAVARAEDAAAVASGRIPVPLPAVELTRRLRLLERAARRERATSGVPTLWLALGLLGWHDGAGAALSAPVVLWPVALEAMEAGGVPRVLTSGARPRLNRALAERLRRDHGLALFADELLRADDDGALPGVAAILAAAEAQVAARGWGIERAAQLGRFSLAAHALWQDLGRFGDALATRPAVAALLGRAAPARDASGAAARDASASGAPLATVLDADAAQRAAVALAASGEGFVLDAPPGTGATQAIANLVAACAGEGRTVLVVAARRSARAAIRARLAAAGLADFALELDGVEGTRGTVIAALARVVDRAFRPGSAPAGDADALDALAAELDRHLAALHAARPLGRTLHAVLGRLIELDHLGGEPAAAAVADPDAARLDAAAFARRHAALVAVAEAAGAALPIAANPWRASATTAWSPAAAAALAAALRDVDLAARALEASRARAVALVPGLAGRTPAELDSLGALAALAAASPRPGAELVAQARPLRPGTLAAGDGELGERIALVRARGGGALDVPREPLEFLALATRHRALAAEVAASFGEKLAGLDVQALWQQLRRWNDRIAPVRALGLRAVRQAVADAAAPGVVLDEEAARTALEAAIAERACADALRAAWEPARRWFGALAADPLALDLARVEAAISWSAALRRAFDAASLHGGEAARPLAWRALVAQVAAPAAPGDADGGAVATPGGDDGPAVFAGLAAAVAHWREALAALAAATGIEEDALGAGPDHVAALIAQVEALAPRQDGLGAWVAYHAARSEALAAGATAAVAALEGGAVAPAGLPLAWERATLAAWAEAALAAAPAAHQDAAAYQAAAASFAELDRGALALARARILVRLAERVPRGHAEPSPELAVLTQEARRPSARPLREVLAALAPLLPRIAPCVLAGPAEVAAHLDPGLPLFDVVLVEDAAQLPPGAALGAVARGRAAVIVGDPRRQGPVGVFADGPLADEDGAAPRPVPPSERSLFDAAAASGAPALALGWHHRGRHEDAIALGADLAWPGRLRALPAAVRDGDRGLALRSLGGGADEAAEVEAVLAEALGRLRDPAQAGRTLAIATFSASIARQLEERLEDAAAAEPGLAARLGEADGAEPVVIVDLGAAAMEARDVVLVAVGGGRGADGRLAGAAAALGDEDGARRVVAAATGARERVVVFSRLAASDLDGVDGSGAAALAALLRRAAGAPADEAPRPLPPALAVLARGLEERGWLLRRDVGVGIDRLPLAVVDPADPTRFVLALEDDGEALARLPRARDRERLRVQALAALGWRLHRVHALDLWRDPERELQRAVGAVVAAVAASRQGRRGLTAPIATRPATARIAVVREAATGATPSPGVDGEVGGARPRRGASGPVPRTVAGAGAGRAPASAEVERGSGPVAGLAAGSGPVAEVAAGAETAPLRVGRGAIPIGPYAPALVPAGRRAPDDLFAPRHARELGNVIERVLAAEAPMHLDRLVRKVAAYFGIARVTPRIAAQITAAFEGHGRHGAEAGVVWRLDQDPASVPAVRVAGRGPETRREIDEVPLAELAAAARLVVERAGAISTAELCRDAARLLGFARITDQVTARVAAGVRLAATRTLIAIADERASLPGA